MKKSTAFVLSASIALGQATSSFAAVTATPVFVQTPNRGIVQFLQGTDVAGTYKTLYTGGTNGSKCTGMYITSNDTAAHLVTIQLVVSGVKYGGTAISTGTTTPGFASGAGALNAMSSINWPGLPTDSDGNPYFYFAGTGDTIQATFATALTASDVINIVAICADF
jgi:hypothetical protein